MRRAEEEHMRDKGVAQRVTKAKFQQCQVQMVEVSGSRWAVEKQVCPSPRPMYMRLIQKQITQVSFLVLGYSITLTVRNREVVAELEGAVWGLCLAQGEVHSGGWESLL